MRYLFCWYIESEFTLPAKLQTEEDGLRAPLALEAKLYPVEEVPPTDEVAR